MRAGRAENERKEKKKARVASLEGKKIQDLHSLALDAWLRSRTATAQQEPKLQPRKVFPLDFASLF